MKTITSSFLILIATFFISCGENTKTPIITDVSKIEIDDTNATMYSTDSAKSLSSTVTYNDNTTANATQGVTWLSSDSNILMMSQNSALASANGGDVNISIEYEQFNDTIGFKVYKLESVNYSDIDISDTSNSQTIYVSGNFDNNETNVSMSQNIVWISDSNSTISESNSSEITLTLHDTQSLLTGTLFDNTFYHMIAKKLISINYSDINASDINNTQIIYITGNYENNETNITINTDMVWQSDDNNNSTIVEGNSTQISLIIYNTPTTITGTIYSGTPVAEDFNHTITAN